MTNDHYLQVTGLSFLAMEHTHGNFMTPKHHFIQFMMGESTIVHHWDIDHHTGQKINGIIAMLYVMTTVV